MAYSSVYSKVLWDNSYYTANHNSAKIVIVIKTIVCRTDVTSHTPHTPPPSSDERHKRNINKHPLVAHLYHYYKLLTSFQLINTRVPYDNQYKYAYISLICNNVPYLFNNTTHFSFTYNDTTQNDTGYKHSNTQTTWSSTSGDRRCACAQKLHSSGGETYYASPPLACEYTQVAPTLSPTQHWTRPDVEFNSNNSTNRACCMSFRITEDVK